MLWFTPPIVMQRSRSMQIKLFGQFPPSMTSLSSMQMGACDERELPEREDAEREDCEEPRGG